MFGEERITRKCVITFTGGDKVVGTLSMPKPKKLCSQKKWNVTLSRVLMSRSLMQTRLSVFIF